MSLPWGDHQNRIEILDGFHLKENLYKVGGSWKRLKQAEHLLWQGKVESTLQLFSQLKKKVARNFCQYSIGHKNRIINYQYHQKEQISSIGSGSIESGIKQIGMRVKKTGAKWKLSNVNKILSLRCAYLNGVLSK